MKTFEAHADFNPEKDVPSLEGKVIFITGAGETAISSIRETHPDASLSSIPMDLTSMASVKESVTANFTHTRLDILLLNAGIMNVGPTLSPDGYEIQFATNHLGHAMLTQCLLPTLLSTAALPNSDITSISLHPGLVKTDLVGSQSTLTRWLISGGSWIQGVKLLEPEQGCWNSVYCAAVAKKEDLKNGGFYYPVGADITDTLTKVAKDEKLAAQLWEWTQGVLAKF
ncbi:NAD(P)-binding protein [Byssothecium circinans]|uniref:NAD(P)-binding protein n=1 Tax=Byssothecium circinans TaxID=147558 RepID=A0A6A5UD98_9PLEO|nr:NAD(P)-binding protein [Byssothecium circinans]